MPKHIKPEVVPGAPVLLDREQAARALGCTQGTLRKYVADGVLPEIAIGRLRRIPASAIERMIAQACGGDGVSA